MRLEDKLMADVKAGKEIDIERALLILSGLKTEKEIAEYKLKLDEIDAGFQVYMEAKDIDAEKPVEVARAWHNYLWNDNKKRYNSNYRLTDVIDAQRSLKNKPVGNCVGLTALYTVLALRHGLKPSVLSNTTHLLSRLNLDKPVNIENTKANGFNNIARRPYNPYQEHGLYGLLAVVLDSRACKKNESQNYKEALDDLLMAKQLNSSDKLIFSHLASVKSKLFGPKEAIKDYDKAIKLDDLYADAFNDRGCQKFKLGEFKSALEDFKTAAELEPTHTEAFENLIATRLELGQIKEAIEDYHWLKFIAPENDANVNDLRERTIKKYLIERIIKELKKELAVKTE